MAIEPNAMKGLSTDMILNLVQNSRKRNAYGPKLVDFCENSDEAGINPAEVWPLEFGGKSAGTLYQGFNTALRKAKLEDTLTLRKVGDNVFILHNERVQLALSNAAEDTEQE